jgi:hypothetical protein
MANVDIVKSNIKKMIDQNAPESDIDAYLKGTGLTTEDLKGPKAPVTEPSEARFIGDKTREQYFVNPPAARDAFNEYGRPILEGVGMGVGGVVGAAAGPLGSVAGGAGGYAMAKKVGDITENIINYFEKSMPGMSPKQKDMKEQAVSSLMDLRDGAMIQMGGELGSGLVINPIAKILAPYADMMKRTGGQYVNETAKKWGVKLSPAEQTGSKGLGLIESAFGKTPQSGDVVADWVKENQIQPLMRAREELLVNPGATGDDLKFVGQDIHKRIREYVAKRTGLKDEALERLVGRVQGEVGLEHNYYDLGMTEQARLEAASASAVARKNQMYADAGAAIPQTPNGFETPNLNRVAENLMREGKDLPKMSGQTNTWLKWAKGEVPMSAEMTDQLGSVPAEVRDQILAQIKNESPELLAKRLDWTAIQNGQKRLSALANAEDLSIKSGNPKLKGQMTPEGRVYRMLADAADADMRLIADSTGGQAKDLLDLADAFYKDKIVDVYKKDIVKKLAYSDPSKMVELTFKPNEFRNLEVVKEALGPEGFMNLRDGFTSQLLGGTEFNPKSLGKRLIQYGDEYLTKVYSPAELAFLKKTSKQGLKLESMVLPSENIAKNLVKSNPDIIIDSILGSVESKPMSKTVYNNVSLMKRVLPKEEFDKLGEQFYQKIFRLNQRTDLIDPIAMANSINKYDERGVLNLFGKEQADAVREIASFTNRMSASQLAAANPSGTAQNAMTIGLMGMIVRNPVLGVVNMLTTRQAAKILYSPMGSKWLTQGFKLPANSKEGLAISAKIIGIMNQDKLDEAQNKTGDYVQEKVLQ